MKERDTQEMKKLGKARQTKADGKRKTKADNPFSESYLVDKAKNEASSSSDEHESSEVRRL